MKVLKKRYEKGKKHPNAGGILGTGTPAEGDMRRAWMILDDFYSDVSKSLLDDPLFDVLDIRTEAIREMQSNIDKNR